VPGGGQRKLFGCVNDIGYVLKADVRHYFDTINHQILVQIVERKIKDKNVIWLLKTILNNHKTKVSGKGMPIGNLTSQFLANVHLNDFDKFVKHKLKVRYYIRYVDDFVILNRDKVTLEKWRREVDNFLKNILEIELHPEKTRIIPLKRGITFLGFRVFHHHRLLKKSNTKRIWKRLEKFKEKYDEGAISREHASLSLEGWLAYAKFADTYKLRARVDAEFDKLFS
jgi:RNA-directed DNA polymerase